MPKPRLPWFKVWVGATRHEKVVTLSDRAFRTWVELLDAGSEQPVRGHFPSYGAAAAIVRRPVSVVRQVAAAGLLDERPDGVWLHDWTDWQRWRAGDGITQESLRNHSGITQESLANAPPNDSGITLESHLNDVRIARERHTKNTRLTHETSREDVDGEERRETSSSVGLSPGSSHAGARENGLPREVAARLAQPPIGDGQTDRRRILVEGTQ